jgi:N-acetylneuraminic acid mutarotase
MATIFSRMWQTPTALPVGKTNGFLVEYENRLYHVGGSTDADFFGTPEIYSAVLHADGTIDSWIVAGTLPVGMAFHAACVHNGWMYVIGGNDTSNTRLNTVYVAKLGSNGVIGTWKKNSVPIQLGAVNNPMGLVVVGDFLYSIAGGGAAAITANCFSVNLNSDGTLDEWRRLNYPVPQALTTTVVHHDGWMYVIGGSTNGAAANDVSTVYAAAINTAGGLGPWMQVSSLPQPMDRFCACVVRGNLITLGGRDTSGVNIDKIYTAKLDTGGQLGPWKTDDTLFPVAMRNNTVVVKNNRLWVGSGFSTIRDPNVYSIQL